MWNFKRSMICWGHCKWSPSFKSLLQTSSSFQIPKCSNCQTLKWAQNTCPHQWPIGQLWATSKCNAKNVHKGEAPRAKPFQEWGHRRVVSQEVRRTVFFLVCRLTPHANQKWATNMSMQSKSDCCWPDFNFALQWQCQLWMPCFWHCCNESLHHVRNALFASMQHKRHGSPGCR